MLFSYYFFFFSFWPQLSLLLTPPKGTDGLWGDDTRKNRWKPPKRNKFLWFARALVVNDCKCSWWSGEIYGGKVHQKTWKCLLPMLSITALFSDGENTKQSVADEEEMVRIHVMDAHHVHLLISGGIDKWAGSSNSSNNLTICIRWYFFSYSPTLLIAVARLRYERNTKKSRFSKT